MLHSYSVPLKMIWKIEATQAPQIDFEGGKAIKIKVVKARLAHPPSPCSFVQYFSIREISKKHVST